MLQSLSNHPYFWSWISFGLLTALGYARELTEDFKKIKKRIRAEDIFIGSFAGCLLAVFVSAAGPLLFFGQLLNGNLQWPLTKSQSTWLWDNGVVFLPVVATLCVWLM